jgi:hypothetical protein
MGWWSRGYHEKSTWINIHRWGSPYEAWKNSRSSRECPIEIRLPKERPENQQASVKVTLRRSLRKRNGRTNVTSVTMPLLHVHIKLSSMIKPGDVPRPFSIALGPKLFGLLGSRYLDGSSGQLGTIPRPPHQVSKIRIRYQKSELSAGKWDNGECWRCRLDLWLLNSRSGTHPCVWTWKKQTPRDTNTG